MGSVTEGLSSHLGIRLRSLSWPIALIAIVVVRAVVSFAAKPGSTHPVIRRYQLFSSAASGGRFRHPQWNPEYAGEPAVLGAACTWL